MKFNEDDRAQRLLDIFPQLEGQINVSYVNSTEHIVAWHKHKLQTDYWICLKGSFKVGLATLETFEGSITKHNVTFEYLSDKNPRVLEIKPGIYHGYKALEPGSIILYYLTHKWSLEDEFKVIPGHFGEIWIAENK
tara:strand:+ start:122 stop:529 length:408 start_codon:yes stop_codon:yes gene_type:complete